MFYAALLEILCLVSNNSRFYLCSCVQDDDPDIDRTGDGLESSDDAATHIPAPSNGEAGAPDAAERGAASPSPFAAFITRLNYEVVTSRDDLAACLLSLIPDWQGTYGLLSFLYSVVLTHGVQNIRESMADDQDQSLVDPTYGQGRWGGDIVEADAGEDL